MLSPPFSDRIRLRAHGSRLKAFQFAEPGRGRLRKSSGSADRPAELMHPKTLLGDRLSEFVDAENQLAGEGCLLEVVFCQAGADLGGTCLD